LFTLVSLFTLVYMSLRIALLNTLKALFEVMPFYNLSRIVLKITFLFFVWGTLLILRPFLHMKNLLYIGFIDIY